MLEYLKALHDNILGLSIFARLILFDIIGRNGEAWKEIKENFAYDKLVRRREKEERKNRDVPGDFVYMQPGWVVKNATDTKGETYEKYVCDPCADGTCFKQ